eukprot:TRINITY_DN7280_c0_g1_i5.p1 TRINITY_DN7280_c0_g1~~TRINITY_DN7280_c0_g1_i5.p1  ORF type:complete len:403 (+),score=68.84 TRINITY_DN7280_c0_g1_i5:81-1289(+)
MDHTEDEPLPPFVSWADQCVGLKLVDNRAQADAASTFPVEYTHQVFGASEKIYGYKDLKITLEYGSGSLLTNIDVAYGTKASKEETGVEADNVLRSLAEWVPEGFTTNRNLFLEQLDRAEARFRPPGEQVGGYSTETGDYQVFLCQHDTPGFAEYHARAQMFLIWYIEAASFIDLTDPNWRILHLYRYSEGPEGSKYSLVGFITKYLYYAFPEHIRPRISQMLVLPPYQRQGHGYQLLQAAYALGQSLDKVIDITVEDASSNFTSLADNRLRDVVDLTNCLQDSDIAQYPLNSTYPDAFTQLLRNKLRLPRIQARRLYEMLLLRQAIGKEPKAEGAFHTCLMRRLMQPYLREQRAEERSMATLAPNEREAYLAERVKEMQAVDEVFKQVRASYLQTIERVHN